MTSEAKTVDSRSNLIGKRCWYMKRAMQCFFLFFLAIILLELSDSFKKIKIAVLSSKFDFLVTYVDLNIDLA